MEATAKFDYEATAPDELSFWKGAQLKILHLSGNWYKAEHNGDVGFVPKNFINIHLPSWYKEDCSRTDAREMLMPQPVGAFVIRGSQTSTGDFSITVRHSEDVQHFKVLRNSRGQYYLWTETFPSLNQLVEHYKHNSISIQTQIFLKETQQQQNRGLDSKHSAPAPPPARCPPVPAPRQFKPAPKRQVRALYSFQAEETDELGFNVGDIIEVLECSDKSWWRGQLGGKTGLFPSNYTKPL